MSSVAMQIFNGISLGSVLLLVAMGLAITFGLMRVINMAHGDLIMIGAYVTYLMQVIFVQYIPEQFFDWYFILAIPAAFIIVAGIGMLLEFTVIRHLYGRPLDSLLATFGAGLILQQLIRTIFGAPNVGVQSPSFLQGSLEIFGLYLPFSRLFMIGLVIVCLVVYSSTCIERGKDVVCVQLCKIVKWQRVLVFLRGKWIH